MMGLFQSANTTTFKIYISSVGIQNSYPITIKSLKYNMLISTIEIYI